MTDGVSRRRTLALFGTTTAAALAGCSDDDSSDDDGSGGFGPQTGGEGNGGGTDDAEVEDTGPAPEDVTYGDIVAFESSFAVDIEITGEMPATGTQVVHEGDYRVEIEEEGGPVVEMYGIDGEHYINVMGNCEFDSRDPEDGSYVDTDLEPDSSVVSNQAVGTATIGGEEVYVFEDDAETIYVSVDTGYPIRSETENQQVDFHSWGATQPITLPDECD
ncbi:hypothetical protein [Halovivax gelatinilyticus]|uniref:hypothetical protein n=1 Tax=Halovivax gelatinilyticus TaxID=2961597 RepID=UPI0020CA3F43|nr:hypothetical protein [Halovivax gelatinilyticus]